VLISSKRLGAVTVDSFSRATTGYVRACVKQLASLCMLSETSSIMLQQEAMHKLPGLDKDLSPSSLLYSS
jgi:hypothetical protein